MNYKIVEEEGKFVVLEKHTELKIKKFDEKEAARRMSRYLNFGGGFDGFTPAFMKQKYFFDATGKMVLMV